MQQQQQHPQQQQQQKQMKDVYCELLRVHILLKAESKRRRRRTQGVEGVECATTLQGIFCSQMLSPLVIQR